MASGDITVDILARDHASRTFSKVGRESQTLGGKIGKLGSKITKYGKIAALGFAAAGAGAAIVGKKLIDAGENASTSNARIENITKSMGLFGKQSDDVARRLVKLAEKQAIATGVDQNAIKATQAKLLTFKELAKSADKAGGAFDRANAAAVDMAAAGFGEAEMNAVQLGKALNDPVKGITALTRSGITFSQKQQDVIKKLVETGKAGKAQDLILKAIEQQVGGTAKATANATDRIKVAFSQVAERLGTRLLPYFEQFANWFIKDGLPVAEKWATKALQKITQGFLWLRFAVQKASDWLGPKLGAAIEFVRGLMEKFQPESERLANTWRGKLAEAVKAVKQAFEDAKPTIDTIKEVLKRLGPVIETVVWPALKKIAEMQFDRTVRGIKIAGKAIKAFGVLVRVMWNSYTAPVLRLMLSAFSGIIRKIGELLSTMGRIKGAPKWMQETGDKLQRAADKADALRRGITNIPNRKNVDITVTTFYRTIGARPPQGGAGQGLGVLKGDRAPANAGRAGMMGGDLRAALSGMRITIVDGDAGRRAIMSAPGVI